MQQKNISELIANFEEWYKSDPHALEEDYYIETMNADHLKNLSRQEFFDFITEFIREGGKVQSGGYRNIDNFKKLLMERGDEVYTFLLRPLEANFDVKAWLDEVEDYKGFGQGAATIYLNRIDKNRFAVVNDKSINAFKRIGYEIKGTLHEKYEKIHNIEKQLIEQFPSLNNFFKVDALTHFIIGVEEGKQLVEKIFQPMRKKIEKLIQDYKNLKRKHGHEDEFYKYQAIQHFQNNWNIEAQNFADMLKKAFQKQYNLVYQNSISSLNLMAKAEPEKVREIFRQLYDESKDLGQRIVTFKKQADEIIQEIKPEWQSQQDERTISVYLSFRYPEKYYIYKDSFYSKFVKLLGKTNAKAGSKYLHYLELMQNFKKDYVDNDQELWNLTNAKLPNDAWPDTSRIVLAQDILYCTLDKKDLRENDSENESELIERFRDIGSRAIVETHLRYLEKMVANLGLESDDQRLCFATRQKNGLPATINQRYIIWSRHEKGQDDEIVIGLMLLKADTKKYSKIVGRKDSSQYDPYRGEKAPPHFAYFKSHYLLENEELYSDWLKAVKYELQRAKKSNFLKFHNPLYFKAIVDKGYREAMLEKAFGRSRVREEPNIILYGPPGTGKTYALKNDYFSKFIEERKMSETEFLDQKLANTPWWQVIVLAMLELKKAKVKDIEAHRFLQAKIRASSNKTPKNTIWSWLQRHTKTDCPNVNFAVRDEPLIFWKDDKSNWEIDINIVREELPELLEKLEELENFQPQESVVKRYEFVTFHQSYSYEDFVEGIKPVMSEDKGGEGDLVYEIKDGVFKTLVKRAKDDPDHDYALFIDEINRGNVAATFGELITLIEEDKREGAANALSATLPYSREKFSVPPNVHIIATMNTADRSVEALDTALRRRFVFIEKSPNPMTIEQPANFSVDLRKLLETINLRIERLLNKDHCIGHSYFMNIVDERDHLHALKQVFANKVIPLLEEYFYGDMSKIGSILGSGFVKKIENHIPFATDFPVDEFEEKEIYRIKSTEHITEEDFISIYETTND